MGWGAEHVKVGSIAQSERLAKCNRLLEIDFGDVTGDPQRFLAAAIEVEELSLAAFNGQVPNLTKRRILTVMGIASVEARHVGLGARPRRPEPCSPAGRRARHAGPDAGGDKGRRVHALRSGGGMETDLTLEDVDPGGAIAEAVDELTGGTRADFVRKAVIGGSATAAALAAPAVAQGRNTAKDIAILRFDLNLEYLQAAMYSEAERLRQLKPRTLEWARVVGANEAGT